MTRITFLGGAGTVTGSKTLIESAGQRILIDCGLFQGLKTLRTQNWSRLPVPPAKIDAVVLTHAHLDHSGWLPRLVKQGFTGPVHCTEGSADLLSLLLPDAGFLQEEDARHANRRGYSKHEPAAPLYTEREAWAALTHVRPWRLEDPLELAKGLTVRFREAGHILGASMVELTTPEGRLLFTGDLGRFGDPVMRDPVRVETPDLLVMESTYGDRTHPDEQAQLDKLATVVTETARKGGIVLVPSFAIGRAQRLLWTLSELRREGRIPEIPTYLNSPMAVDATEIYQRHTAAHRLSPEQIGPMCKSARLVRSEEESRNLNGLQGPAIVISASGMLAGGRVLHHLRSWAPDERNTLLFVGYQAPGTRGRAILGGTKQIKVHGQRVDVRCRVERIESLSAHADQTELVRWLGSMDEAPGRILLNHGDPEASDALRARIQDELGWRADVVRHGQSIELGAVPRLGTPVPPPMDASSQMAHPSYRRADHDTELLQRDELRATRLMLEFAKTDLVLRDQGIEATVVVFGSARIEPDHPSLARFYQEAMDFARLASTQAVDGGQRLTVMTGGGPGIMAAANRGAHEAGARSVGLNIDLPFEQAPNPWVTPELCFRFRYFGLRKMHMMMRAKAMVGFPGGYGTLDELSDVATLIQTGKMPHIPVVLVGREHWKETVDLQRLVDHGLMSPEDMALLTIVDTGAQAWEVIQAFYAHNEPQAPHPRDL